MSFKLTKLRTISPLFQYPRIFYVHVYLGVGVNKYTLIALGEKDDIGRGSYKTQITDFIEKVTLSQSLLYKVFYEVVNCMSED